MVKTASDGKISYQLYNKRLGTKQTFDEMIYDLDKKAWFFGYKSIGLEVPIDDLEIIQGVAKFIVRTIFVDMNCEGLKVLQLWYINQAKQQGKEFLQIAYQAMELTNDLFGKMMGVIYE